MFTRSEFQLKGKNYFSKVTTLGIASFTEFLDIHYIPSKMLEALSGRHLNAYGKILYLHLVGQGMLVVFYKCANFMHT